MTDVTDSLAPEPIAIVGMACRVPGAADVASFWRNLCDGAESVRFFSEEELRAAGVGADEWQRPGYVPAHGWLDGVDRFDAEFFGISPREAEALDPQHRVFLECAWEAIEHAGHNPDTVGERFGVVASAGLNTYLLSNILPRKDLATPANFYSLFIANDKDFLPTRVSYKLNLRGPSLNVNTACSSSLVAVHVACQMLWSYQCDGALAGGVSLQVPQVRGYQYQPGAITSPDGHCRAFDASAAGTVTGSGVGVVVLKRLSDALAAGDTIHAVIRGSAVNNDGSLKAGYTAPGVEGQAAVIAEALAVAGVSSTSVSYVEAHGTGTPLGDPIEISALTQAFGSAARSRPCAIGAVKTNIGHLDSAAGVAGLIKATLALEHELIPPTLHFREPNPKIDFAASPFVVCDTATAWPRETAPRLAGVSSFGIGGTNAHVVLEEAPSMPERPLRSVPRLCVLSARTASGLDRAISRLASHLPPDSRLDDVAWTLAVGRKVFAHAAYVVADSVDDLVTALRAGRVTRGQRPTDGTPNVGAPGTPAERVDRAYLTALGQTWLDGGLIDWPALFSDDQPRRIPLPTYPFEPVRHWIEPVAESSEARDLSDWFYVPTWEQTPPLVDSVQAPLAGRWLVLARESGKDQPLVDEMVRRGASVATIGPAEAANVAAVVARLARDGQMPDRVLHCWTRDVIDPATVQELGFNTILRFMRALSHEGRDVRDITLLTSGVGEVTGQESLVPHAATLLGLVGAIPPEYPGIGCRLIDADPNVAVADLARELAQTDGAAVTAWRGRTRWIARFEALHLPPVSDDVQPFTPEGVYLVTGGVGGLGLVMAEHLARTARAHLVLTTRRALPPEGQWESLARDGVRQSGIPGSLAELTPQVEVLEHRIDKELGIQRIHERKGLLEAATALSAAYALEYLHSRGVLRRKGDRTTRAAIHAACEVLPQFSRLVDHLLTTLAQEGFVRIEGDDVVVLKASAPSSAEAQLAEASAAYPGMAPTFELLQYCVSHYPDALSGRVSAVGVLFPDGGRGRIVEAAMRTDEYANNRVYRTLLADLLAELAVKSTRRPFRILEVGGGNAIMTGLIAERLHALDVEVEYVFTDIGRSFVMAAEARARELGYGFMRFATFDISRDPAAQGFEPGSFDAVIGLDVVHATPVIADTVRNLRGLLAGGGLFALVESARTHRWNDMVWGLAEGWWLFQDPDLRNDNSPLLSTERWEAALADSGFVSVMAFPRGETERAQTDCSLVLAQRPDGIAGEDPALFQSLLRVREHAASLDVRQVDVADEAAMERVVAETEARLGRINGVIHAAAVEAKALIATREGGVEDREFRPKVDGTCVLDRVFDARPLDFMVLCSSITAVTGGPGQVGYTGANAFLDAFACDRMRRRGELTVSISWGRWQGLGLARDFESWHESRTGEALIGGMTVDDGLEALRRILHYRVSPRVAVMTSEWRPDRRVVVARPLGTMVRPEVAPVRATTRVFDGSPTERQLAAIWAQLLGTDQFDRDTPFQDLGGDSLVGIQVLARVREQLGVQLPIHTVFDAPTIAELSIVIDRNAVEMEEGTF